MIAGLIAIRRRAVSTLFELTAECSAASAGQRYSAGALCTQDGAYAEKSWGITGQKYARSPQHQLIQQQQFFERQYGTIRGNDVPKSEATGFLLSVLPKPAIPYARLMRLDKPIGTWLLAWPSFWSIALASTGTLPDAKHLALFGAGAVLLRGAGCTINDLWDRDLDSKVARTKLRPLAAGEVGVLQGVAFLGAQLSLGLCILLQLNPLSQILGAASLPLVLTYPLMKRVTFWPQAFLGFTINWGALLGWAAVRDSLDLSVTLPLYASGVAWTLVYDTIYAHQDKVDDAKIGVKSTALLFGDKNKQWLSLFAALHGAGLVCSGYFGECHVPFYASSLAGTALMLRRIQTIDLDDPSQCLRTFNDCKWYGALIFTGIAIDKLTA